MKTGAQRALLPIPVRSMNINELMNINDVRESATTFPRPCKLTFDLLTYLESGDRVTCDVRYLCANFGLPKPLCSRDFFPMNVTDRRQTASSRGGGIILVQTCCVHIYSHSKVSIESAVYVLAWKA